MATTTKKKKLLKSQRELLINRQTELTQSRVNIIKELERRDNEIIQNILRSYGDELGLDFENEEWDFDSKEMVFNLVPPKPEPKETIPGK